MRSACAWPGPPVNAPWRNTLQPDARPIWKQYWLRPMTPRLCTPCPAPEEGPEGPAPTQSRQGLRTQPSADAVAEEGERCGGLYQPLAWEAAYSHWPVQRSCYRSGASLIMVR